MPEKTKPKVLLIGWDAADWKVINPLLDAGLMPNFERLVNNGVIGNLATLDPAFSPMLWTSIATGKRPYKHGVLGFTEVTPDGKSVRPVLSTTRKVKAIWDMLSENGYKTHVVGWWPSHPAEAMNGISISNFYQKDVGHIADPWPMSKGTVYPEEMAEHFAQLRVHPMELTGQHILPFIPNAEKIDQTREDGVYGVAKITAHTATIQAAITNILRTQEWDFAAVYFDAIDHYGHGFMKYHPPRRPHISKPDFDLYKDVITAGYRYHDLLLGRLIELAGEETTVMLVSDHGFEPDHLRPDYIPKEIAGRAYEHGPFGIYCMQGPNVRKDELVYGATLLDITPTILNIFDLPVGEDMDGKVLASSFENPLPIQAIPTWETTENVQNYQKKGFELDNDSQKEMIDQLVELGYIDKPDTDVEKWVEDTRRETLFNLSKAYLDGGQLIEAKPLLEELVEKVPDELRYNLNLATCYQGLGHLKDCRALIDSIRKQELFNTPVFDVIESSLLIGENKFEEALSLLKKVDKQFSHPHSRLQLKMARCYYYMGMYKEAVNRVKRAIESDFDLTAAHHLLGVINFHLDRFDDAIEALLNAVGLDYHNAVSHLYLGISLYKSGQYEEAAKALEVCLLINPDINLARQHLVRIYHTHLDETPKAAEHKQQFARAVRGTITIVSGLPRSGTSMMMQMLEKGGLEMFTDKVREKDKNNPKGYYEHEAVKSLRRNKKWVPQAEGKVVKVIANLLAFLPPIYRYRVIFMERDLKEVMSSQRKMLQRMGKNVKDDIYPLSLIQSFQSELRKVKSWASRQENVDIIYVPYKEVIDNPFGQAIRISQFLNREAKPEDMVSAVDANLYREKQAVLESA